MHLQIPYYCMSVYAGEYDMIVGVFYAVALLGSVVAFICGGFLLQIYTHFDTIDLSSSVQDILYIVFVKKFSSNNNNNNYNIKQEC